ncbi:AcrR family transcriptional regulator [Rhodopseudomonas rhenobacensis]|uniref:AcrR family transcriptional regulator n=1 Tax=Rhodopseudomonas rhenobacensis TaxID=87461 RepID=A0A7W8DZP8_9BRAD|nr:TetR/AcrR family transcriptional regulator [Rhodopseudomonas rhenobacensis]MBB5048077.1 AcrR family transcriptional regulator [Rhodopseudomonas rhenobacensis]
MPRWENGFQTIEEIQRYKRYAVIREAARIMSRRGFHHTSLDEVAKVLGISKGTLYNYVEDKQEILFECHNIALDLGEYAAQVASEAGGRGIDKLRLLLRCYIIWMYGQAGIGGITFDVNALRPDDRSAVIKRRDAMDANLVALLEESAADGSIRSCDTKIAVFGIMSAVNGISTWFSPDGRLTIDQVADQLLDLLTLSLATRPEKLAPYPPIPAYPAPEAPLGFLNRSSPAVARPVKSVEKRAKTPAPRKKAAASPKRKLRSTRAGG